MNLQGTNKNRAKTEGTSITKKFLRNFSLSNIFIPAADRLGAGLLQLQLICRSFMRFILQVFHTEVSVDPCNVPGILTLNT